MDYRHPELFIKTDEYTEDSIKYEKILFETQDAIDKYCSILKSLSDEEVMTGAAADSIYQFAETVSETLGSSLSELGCIISSESNKYIETIEEKDSISF